MKPSLPGTTITKAEQQASLFRVFSNSNRLLILWLLEEKERTFPEIELALGLTQYGTSHHIRILELHKFIYSRREKEIVYYDLVDRESLLNCRIFANKPEIMLTEVNLITFNKVES